MLTVVYISLRGTNVCGSAHFSQSGSIPKSGDSGLILNFGNAWFKKDEKSFFTWIFESIEAADRMSVCVFCWNIKRLNYNRRGCFLYLRFDVSSLLSRSPPLRYSLWRRRITRKAGYNLQGLSRPVQELVYHLLLHMKWLTLQNQRLCYNPTRYNIKKFYVLSTQCVYVSCPPKKKVVLISLRSINWLVFIIETECVFATY